MPQQLSQIPVLPARYPDPRKVILQHESQNQLCILSIRLLFAYSFALDLGRVANPQLELQLGQQSFEPACMPTGFHSNTYRLAHSRQSAVELLRLLAIHQPFFLNLPRSAIPRITFLTLRLAI